MLKKLLLFSFLVFMLISCTNKNQKNKIDSVICFGDSLTEGVGADDNQTYPYFLQQKVSIPVINEGIKGDTSQDGLNRLDSLNDVKNSLVIVEFGANDFFRQVPPFLTKQNIEKIVDKLKDKGATVLLVSVEDKQLNLLYKMLQSVAKDKNILFIDGILNEFWNNRNMFFDDVHPNSQGYKIVAEKIYKNIQNIIN